jgi:hypothetical protein
MPDRAKEPAVDHFPAAQLSNIDSLRAAIRANQVAFPVPVPLFRSQNRADLQWRFVALYFVHGWSPARLASRYNVSARRVRQQLRSWVRRAASLGYLPSITE